MSGVGSWAREFAIGLFASMATGAVIIGLMSGAACSDWNCRPRDEIQVETGTYEFGCGDSLIRGAGVEPELRVDREVGIVTWVYSVEGANVQETWRIDEAEAP